VQPVHPLRLVVHEELNRYNTPEALARVLVRRGLQGKRSSASQCPLAMYIRSRLHLPKDIVVSVTRIEIAFGTPGRPDTFVSIRTPILLHDFMRAFDAGVFPELDAEPQRPDASGGPPLPQPGDARSTSRGGGSRWSPSVMATATSAPEGSTEPAVGARGW
jgi:hypothetical protein